MNKIFLLAFLNVAVSASFAQNAQQIQLIQQEERPSIEMLLNSPNLLESFSNSDSNGRGGKVIAWLPRLVVSLERAFPGGKYAFLGRDMDLIADGVDAYYQSLGQMGRVTRIKFSTPSLKGANPELLTEFMQQLGLRTSVSASASPFVIIDYTTYSTRGQNDVNYPSQARYIFESVIKKMQSMGLDSTQILSRINLATLDSNASKNVGLADALDGDRRSFLNEQAAALAKNGKVDRITYLSAGGPEMPYYSEWTGKFGPIERQSSGLLVTKPSSYISYTQKAPVFQQMTMVLRAIKSGKIGRDVEEFAKTYGVTFNPPKDQNSPKKAVIAKTSAADFEFKEFISKLKADLKPLDGDKAYQKVKYAGESFKLTENGNVVLQQLSSTLATNAPHFYQISLESLVDLYEQNKIGARDFRRILAHLLTLKSIDESDFVEMVKTRFKSVLPLEIMFGREAEREKYADVSGLGGANYRKILSDSQLKPSCQFVYSAK